MKKRKKKFREKTARADLGKERKRRGGRRKKRE